MRWVVGIAFVIVWGFGVVIDARSHKLAQRVLTPRHGVDVDVAAVETNANANVNVNGNADVTVAVGYSAKQLAEGAPLADPTHYHYPAAQEGEAGLFPSDALCVNAVNTLATSLNSGEMIGVLIDTAHRILVTAVSAAGSRATYAQSYTTALGTAGWHDHNNHQLSTYTIVDISDAHGQGWSDKLIDATGVTLSVRHKQPDGMKKITGSLPAGVAWGESSRLQDTRTHEMGWPFGSCAGTKLAAYATMAGLTPFCMAERKRDTATIRASCRTCQTVISTLSSVSARAAATDWMAAKTKTRDAALSAVTASEKTLDAARTHAHDLGVHAPYDAADFTTAEGVIRAKILELTGNARTKNWDGGPGAAAAEREVDEAQKQAFAWRCMTSYQKQKTAQQNNFGSKDLCKSQVAALAALYPARRDCPAYPDLCLKKGDTKYDAKQIEDGNRDAENVLATKQDALHAFTHKKEQFEADVAALAKLADAQTKIETVTAALTRERATAAALALSVSTFGRQ